MIKRIIRITVQNMKNHNNANAKKSENKTRTNKFGVKIEIIVIKINVVGIVWMISTLRIPIKSTLLSGFDLMTCKNRFWSNPLNPFMSLPSNYSDSITFASILFLLHLVERGMIQWNSCKLLMTMLRPLGLKINELIPFAIFMQHWCVICMFCV